MLELINASYAVCPPPPLPLAHSIWAHQSAHPGRFPAPRLTDL